MTARALLGQLAVPPICVAACLRVSRRTVAYWISGQKRPGPERRRRLEECFGIPAELWTT